MHGRLLLAALCVLLGCRTAPPRAPSPLAEPTAHVNVVAPAPVRRRRWSWLIALLVVLAAAAVAIGIGLSGPEVKPTRPPRSPATSP